MDKKLKLEALLHQFQNSKLKFETAREVYLDACRKDLDAYRSVDLRNKMKVASKGLYIDSLAVCNFLVEIIDEIEAETSEDTPAIISGS